jgi:hypothetical protein
MKACITARWHEEQEKNDIASNIIYGQLEVLSEIICLGFSAHTVLQVLKSICKPEWRKSVELGKRWCKLVRGGDEAGKAREGMRTLLKSWHIDM